MWKANCETKRAEQNFLNLEKEAADFVKSLI